MDNIVINAVISSRSRVKYFLLGGYYLPLFLVTVHIRFHPFFTYLPAQSRHTKSSGKRIGLAHSIIIKKLTEVVAYLYERI